MRGRKQEMRVQGDGEVGGGGGVEVEGENRLLVDSAPALSSGVHKQTLINRRQSASPRCFFSSPLCLAPSGNNLELGASKRDCSENGTGRTHGGQEEENKGELGAV